jgi:hypothetical protein
LATLADEPIVDRLTRRVIRRARWLWRSILPPVACQLIGQSGDGSAEGCLRGPMLEELVSSCGQQRQTDPRGRLSSRATVAASAYSSPPVIPALIASCAVAVLLVVLYLKGRSSRSSQHASARQTKAEKLDTTLGEFRDMREALRPLEHARTASRRDPQSGK